MPYTTITLSSASVPGQSGVANLAIGRGGPISIAVYTSTTGTATGAFTVQYTLDDIQLVGGASRAFWANISSAIGAAGTVFLSSTTIDGTFISLLSPVAAVRLNSTALSSGPMVMKVIQQDVW
jgi:hypothetical protein